VTDPGDAVLSGTLDPVDATLAVYQEGAAEYLAGYPGPAPELTAFLDRLAGLAGDGEVLEIGSGPGREADYLESRGLRVIRTDATLAFVEMMRAAGRDARLLDVRSDPLGGPYQAVFANAVLLHLPWPQFADAVRRVRLAVVPGGTLAITLKEGDGEGWSHRRLPKPRHFTYWREPGLREVLTQAGWSVMSVGHIAGPAEPWLYVLASACEDPAQDACT
jgi:SAM-dependent methyltransferase